MLSATVATTSGTAGYLPADYTTESSTVHRCVFQAEDGSLFEWTRTEFTNGDWDESKRRITSAQVTKGSVLREGVDYSVLADSLFINSVTDQTALLPLAFPFKTKIYVRGLEGEGVSDSSVRSLGASLEARQIRTALILQHVDVGSEVMQPLLTIKNKQVAHINLDVTHVGAEDIATWSAVLKQCDRLHKVAFRCIGGDAFMLATGILQSSGKIWTVYLDLKASQDVDTLAAALTALVKRSSALSQIDVTWSGDPSVSQVRTLGKALTSLERYALCREDYTPSGLDNMRDPTQSISPACSGDTHNRRWWTYIFR